MEKTYTITQSQLDKALENLNNVCSIKDYSKDTGDEVEYQKYLFEFCGIICTLCDFGLLTEWDKFRADKIRAEMKKETANDGQIL